MKNIFEDAKFGDIFVDVNNGTEMRFVMANENGARLLEEDKETGRQRLWKYSLDGRNAEGDIEILRKVAPRPITLDQQGIIKFLKENPMDRYVILAALLEDDTISIAELVKHKENSLKEVLGNKTEELSNACALVIRYKERINTNTVDNDAQNFLDNCSFTGFAGYGKTK
jgi:hypothetical protein